MLQHYEDYSIWEYPREAKGSEWAFSFLLKGLIRWAFTATKSNFNSNCARALAVNLQKTWNFMRPILFWGFSRWSSGIGASGRAWRKSEHTGSEVSKLTNKTPCKSPLLPTHAGSGSRSVGPTLELGRGPQGLERADPVYFRYLTLA